MASLIQRWTQDASHAFQDMYGNFVLGDDAGDAQKIVVVVQNHSRSTLQSSSHRLSANSAAKHPGLASLGVTFCDIKGRAYVKSVEPGSRADQLGVQPKDCVQYAAILAKEWRDPLGEDENDIQKHALEREEAGQRITYKELKHLLQKGILDYQHEDAFSTFLAPSSVPTTISVGGTNPCGPSEVSATSRPLAKDTSDPRPVVLVFRRTKQWPQQTLPIWPHFRLDDECDVACQILNSLATPSPDQLSPSPTVASSSFSSSNETVEAATIRAMIQKAVGLVFLRSNKFVLGVSIHAGSGIVVARLPDGMWSAPSAVGVAGFGFGLQLGIEIAHTIVILQTQEALEHFQRGGSFTVGANVGAAVGGVGREAAGTASLSAAFCGVSSYPASMVKDDEYHADAQDLNAPSSASVAHFLAYARSQGLYVGLSLEGSRIHVRDDINARTYQFHNRRSISPHELLTGKVAPPPEAEKLYEALHQVEFTHELHSLPRPPRALWSEKPWLASDPPIDLNGDDVQEFEAKFRDFLYGGVYVWRYRGRARENRTLWLYVPEGEGSLQLGFVSKLSSLETKRSSSEQDDRRSITSEEVTLDSALMDNQSLIHPQSVRTQVELSRKHSIELTDVVCISHTSNSDVPPENASDARKVISIQTRDQELVFVVKTDQESHVLMAGLKLLVESEAKRCGVRASIGKGGASFRSKRHGKKNKRSKQSGYSSSDVEDHDDASAMSFSEAPEGWRSWNRAPGRNYLRGQASANDQGYPQYVHGQLLVRDIAKNIHLPLPLPFCRVLLLDSSSSPVISQWEKDRGDVEFEKTPWTFPPATPREGDQYQSEKQLIASGSMCGAHRTISYQRPRNGQMVRLFETQIVDSDDAEKLAFQIHERMPRRGFSIKVKVILRAYQDECEATVLGEIRPVGKNMSDPEAVHKAFLLVIDELRERYGPDGHGLLCGFLNAVNTFKKDEMPPHMSRSTGKSTGKADTFGEEKKEADAATSQSASDSKSIKLEDMLKAETKLSIQDELEPKSLQDRPSTPSPMDMDKYRESYRKPKSAPKLPSDTFEASPSEPVLIEVKPLPKIRLSLMPSPREEDELNLDEDGEPFKSKKSSSEKSGSKSKKTRTSWGKKRRSRKTKS